MTAMRALAPRGGARRSRRLTELDMRMLVSNDAYEQCDSGVMWIVCVCHEEVGGESVSVGATQDQRLREQAGTAPHALTQYASYSRPFME